MYTKALAALAAFLVTSSASPISRRQQSSGSSEAEHKRGVCYTDPSLLGPFAQTASWAYHWTSVPGGQLPEGIEFVPTLHPDEVEPEQGGNGQFVKNAQEALNGNTKHILFLNEPDKAADAETGGTNIDPAKAAEWYKSKSFQGTFGGQDGVKLGGPGISAAGIDWLRQFAAACQGCQFDFIPLHFYDYTPGHIDAQSQFVSFQGFLGGVVPEVQELFKKADGTPADIWITEFGYVFIGGDGKSVVPLPEDKLADQQSYMQSALEWLDGNSDDVSKAIKRYAYFMADKNILLDGSGQLNEAGRTYVA